jgi:hypothetical protein
MANYHPLYGDLWNHRDLKTASLEEIAFYAFLWSNHRQRPSGIYQVTDEQLVSDLRGRLTIEQVRTYLLDLDEKRHRIIRDGEWVFVTGYLKRQPKFENLLKAVDADLAKCDSERILAAFSERYPLLDQRSGKGRAKVAQGLPEGLPKVDRPLLRARTAVAVAVTDTTAVAVQPNDGSRHEGSNNGQDDVQPVTLTPDEERGLPIIAQARRITLAQARSELLTAKLREAEGKGQQDADVASVAVPARRVLSVPGSKSAGNEGSPAGVRERLAQAVSAAVAERKGRVICSRDVAAKRGA